MKIKVLSDTHNKHEQICPKGSESLDCDVLIHCGDATTRKRYSELKTFLIWFISQPAKYKIFVPGNHDKSYRDYIDLSQLVEDKHVHILENDEVVIQGIKFYGNSFVPYYSCNVLQTPIQKCIDAYKDAPTDAEILITHAPPYSVLDTGGKHKGSLGCPGINEYLKKASPWYHFFGHIHEHGGKREHIHYNCCNTNLAYDIVRSERTITI